MRISQLAEATGVTVATIKFYLRTHLRQGDMAAVDYIVNAVNWYVGFRIREDKDDEDRWKRRREKLASKVQEAGGKLVVVPVGSNA